MNHSPPVANAPVAANTGTRTGPALVLIVVSSFLAPFMMSGLNVVLPDIGEGFGLSAVALGWVVTSYILATAVFMLPMGRVADITGRKAVFFRGMLVYALGSLLSALAPSAALLVAARVIQGAGAAMGFATGTAILMSIVPPGARGRVLGWNVASVYLGLSLGPPLGGLMAHDVGWRGIFVIQALAGAAVGALTPWAIRGEWAAAKGERFDRTGSVLYALTLVALLVGCGRLPQPAGAALLAASAAAGAAFLLWERRCASPILHVALFGANPVFAFANVAALINYAASGAVGFLLSIYLQCARGLTPQHAGWILVAQPVVMALLSPAAGRLSDRMPPRRLASAGMLCTAVGLGALCALTLETPVRWIVAVLGLHGIGFALFSSPNTHAIMGSVAPRHFGIASGTVATMRVIGQMFSMAVVMLIVALVLGRLPLREASPEAILRCLHLSFAVLAALCVLGVGASLVGGRGHPADAPRS